MATDHLLVLLTGPVGGGKSTVAEDLGATLRRAGRASGVIDLDLLYCMARQTEGFGDEHTWRTARLGAGALARQFFADGLDAVIVEGGFHSQAECDEVRRQVGTDVKMHLVALRVSVDETVRRVEGDPAIDRVLSRDPSVLRYLHAQFEQALPFLEKSGIVIEASQGGPGELSEEIAERLL